MQPRLGTNRKQEKSGYLGTWKVWSEPNAFQYRGSGLKGLGIDRSYQFLIWIDNPNGAFEHTSILLIELKLLSEGVLGQFLAAD